MNDYEKDIITYVPVSDDDASANDKIIPKGCNKLRILILKIMILILLIIVAYLLCGQSLGPGFWIMCLAYLIVCLKFQE